MKHRYIAAISVAALIGVALSAAPQHASATESSGVRHLRVKVLEERPHDATAFTEGLQLVGGALYESTGLFEKSALRITDPVTGKVRKQVALTPDQFGEGAAVVGNRIWQLTFQNGKALLWDRASLRKVKEVAFSGQ